MSTGDTFTWRELTDRARVYVDDDHQEQQGWITDAKWLELAKVEYRILYRKWLRLGLVRPAPTDTSFSSAYNIALPTAADISAGRLGVLAVVGVAENMTSYMRMLAPAQAARGAYPYWVASGEVNQGKSITWAGTGPADEVTVELSPRDTGSTYVVRWIPVPTMPTSLDSTVQLPFGTDERLVLGLARRAHLKDSGASALLEKLIVEADAELQFAAHGRLDNQAPRVRRVRPDFHRRRWPQLSTSEFPTDPNYWMYP